MNTDGCLNEEDMHGLMDCSLKSFNHEDLQSLMDCSLKSLKQEDVQSVMENIQKDRDLQGLAEVSDLHYRLHKESEEFAPKKFLEEACVKMHTDFCQASKFECNSKMVPQSFKPDQKESSINGIGNYRDFANVPDEVAVEIVNQTHARGPQEHFPLKLHKIIESSEMEGYSSIISWLPHGRAFKIHDVEQFTEKIMQKYFFQTKFASFQRQLKVYGFRKLHKFDKGAYYHELFLRGRQGLCSGIVRSKPASSRGAEEPNLYDIPPLPTTHVRNDNQDIARLNDHLQPVRYIHSSPPDSNKHSSGNSHLYAYPIVVSGAIGLMSNMPML